MISARPPKTPWPSTRISQLDGKLAYFTLTARQPRLLALDISDLNNVKRLDDPNEVQPIVGPHYVKISPDKKNLIVTGYFVEAGDISVLNTPGDPQGPLD